MKFTFIILAFSLLYVIPSKAQKVSDIDVVNKIAALKEFKIADEKAKAESQQLGFKKEAGISLIVSWFDKADSIKNLRTAFIRLNGPMDEPILYIIKFDATSGKIVSVEDNRRKEIKPQRR